MPAADFHHQFGVKVVSGVLLDGAHRETKAVRYEWRVGRGRAAGAMGMHNEDSSQGSLTWVRVPDTIFCGHSKRYKWRRTRIMYFCCQTCLCTHCCRHSYSDTPPGTAIFVLCRKHTRNQRPPQPTAVAVLIKESRQSFASSRTPRALQNVDGGTAKIRQIQDTQFYLML